MSLTNLSTPTTVETTLCRGILYEVLSIGLRPPSQDGLDRLGERESSESLLEVAAVLDSQGGTMPVGPSVAKVAGAAREADVRELRAAYERLFGHTARGKVPPYETEYGGDDLFRQSEELADVGGFLQAFGLTLSAPQRERGDHIAAECEFLSFLSCKEAYDLIEDRCQASEDVRRAERLFLRDHLGRFAPAFARSLLEAADHPFYRAVADLCYTYLTAECRRFGLEPGPDLVRLRSAADDGVPMACGACPLNAAETGEGEPHVD